MSLITTILGLTVTMASAPTACIVDDSIVATVGTSQDDAPTASPTSDPFVLEKTERRMNCTGGSFHVTLRNTDDEARDVRICLAQQGGTWDCSVFYGVKPQQTASSWKCSSRATGRYWWVSRPSSSSERLPHPPR